MNSRCAVRTIIVGLLSLVVVMITSGCAVTKHTSHPTEIVRSQIRKVVVVPAVSVPREDFIALKQPEQPSAGLSGTAPEEENEKAGSGDPEVDKQWKLVAEAAWSDGWHMPAGAGFATAALLHPALGAFVALSTNAPVAVRMLPEDKAKTEAAIAGVYNRQDVQKNAAEQIVEAGRRLTNIEFVLAGGRTPADTREKPDYHHVAAAGDTVLEVKLKDIGFVSGSGPDPLAALFMLADIRTVKTADGTVVYADTTAYVSRKRKLSEWMGNGALSLKTEIQSGHAGMAERIVEKMFLVQEIEPVSIWSGPLCMFDIYSPKTPGMRLGSLYLSTPEIDTLQPLFQWEPFPRERDRKADTGGLLAKIADVTYDLKIWKVSDDLSQTLVYEKTGFSPVLKTIEKQVLDSSPVGGTATYKTVAAATAEHTVEKPLDPSTVYFWSIRSRFKLNGQTRVTKWAYSRVPFPPTIPDPCKSDHIDFMHYYRFKTPAR